MTATLGPAELSVECSGQQHRLRWADGTLTALDHPDADGERTLAALGGDPATCIQILDTWLRYDADLTVLVSASRGPHDPLAPPPSHGGGFMAMSHSGGRRPRRAASGWNIYGPAVGAPMPGTRNSRSEGFGADLAALLTLGRGFPERLAATVIGNWAARIERGEEVSEAVAALQTALYGRLVPIVREWLGDSTRVTTLELAAAGTAPEIVSGAGTLRLAFPFSWLRDVWAPGLSLMLDELCVAARQDEDGSWTLTTLDRDLATRHTVTLGKS